jgi:hypothetical protein
MAGVPGSHTRYNVSVMHLALIGMHILVVLFFVGLIGSSLVIIISFVEDLHELFGE